MMFLKYSPIGMRWLFSDHPAGSADRDGDGAGSGPRRAAQHDAILVA